MPTATIQSAFSTNFADAELFTDPSKSDEQGGGVGSVVLSSGAPTSELLQYDFVSALLTDLGITNGSQVTGMTLRVRIRSSDAQAVITALSDTDGSGFLLNSTLTIDPSGSLAWAEIELLVPSDIAARGLSAGYFSIGLVVTSTPPIGTTLIEIDGVEISLTYTEGGPMNYYFDGATHTWTGANTATMSTSSDYSGSSSCTVASGDTVHFRNTYRGTPLSSAQILLSGLSNVTLIQGAGQTQFRTTGRRTTGSFTNSATDTHTITLASGLNTNGGIATVVYKYLTSTKTTSGGFTVHYGFLSKAASAVAVASNADTWFYDNTTGVLTVNIGGTGTTPPSAGEVEYVVGNSTIGDWNGVILSNCSGCLVSGLHADCICPRAIADGNAFLLSGNTTNTTVDSCYAWDCGDHHFYSGSGGTNANNSFTNCFGGCLAKHVSDSCYVAYTTSGDITGARFTNCSAYVSISLSRNQTTAFTVLPSDNGSTYTTQMNGFSCHTNTPGTQFVSDVEISGCVAEINPLSCNRNSASTGWTGVYLGFESRNGRAITGDISDFSSYPWRVSDSRMINGVAFGPSDGCPLAFDRCVLNMDGAASAEQKAQYNTSNGLFHMGAYSNTRTLFRNCDFSFTGPPGLDIVFIRLCRNTGSVNNVALFDRCTFVTKRTDASNMTRFIEMGNVDISTVASTLLMMSNRTEFRDCIFYNNAASNTNSRFIGWIFGTGSFSLATFVNYLNISRGYIYGWGSSLLANLDGGTVPPLIDTQAEWATTNGANAVMGPGILFTDPGLLNPATDGKLNPSGAAASRLLGSSSTPRTDRGLNLVRGRNAGAYQYSGYSVGAIGGGGQALTIIITD